MASLRNILKENFPWLGTDEPADGAEVIAKLGELYRNDDPEIDEDHEEDYGAHDPRNDRDEDDDEPPTIWCTFHELAIGDRFISDELYYTKVSVVTAQLEETPVLHSFMAWDNVRKIVGKA